MPPLGDVRTPAEPTRAETAHQRTPPGFFALSLLALWDRFAFYGVRAILVIYLVTPAEQGGAGMRDADAALSFGLYVSVLSFFGLGAGWLSDQVGRTRALVLIGAACIAGGLATIAIGTVTGASRWLLAAGLWIDGVGMSLLRTNVNMGLARLYPPEGATRDAGFSLYYMGVNLGSLLGALAVPAVAQILGWPAGFGLASLAVAGGGLLFAASSREARIDMPVDGLAPAKAIGIAVAAVILLAVLPVAIGWLVVTGRIGLDDVSDGLTQSIVVLGLAFIAYVWRSGADVDERRRVLAVALLSLGGAAFVAGFSQAGSSLSIFAARFTALTWLGVTIPAGALQAVFPLSVILLAPAAAWTWKALEARGRTLSGYTQIGIGLVLMGAGFAVMAHASGRASSSELVAPLWLVSAYLLHSIGDLCVGPLGLSASSKLAPPRLLGQFMALWAVGNTLGHNLSGRFASKIDTASLAGMQSGFWRLTLFFAVSAAVMFLLAPVVGRLLARGAGR